MDSLMQMLEGFLYVIALVAVVDAVLHVRTSQGAIAWTVSLLTMPVITLPLYLIFGRRTFDRYIEARKNLGPEINPKVQHLSNSLSAFRYALKPEERCLQVMETIAPLPFTHGNKIDLLCDGEASFAAIFQAIDSARHYIVIQFYILRHDNIGYQLQKRLIAKARQNVAVYVLYDSVGSFELKSDFINEMRQAGISVCEFNTTNLTSNRFQLNFRNHRKIVIVDGETAFIGGLNVGDEYLAKVAEFPVWRDTHFQLSGPCVQVVQLAFVEDWISVANHMPDLRWSYPSASEQASQGLALLVLPWGPDREVERGTFSFLHLINSAQKRLWLASPYFIPDVVMRSALQLAVLRGVDVRILVPEQTDNLLNQLGTFSNVKRLIPSGIKFYFYTPGFMHQKIMLLDDSISFIGSANFSNRSFHLNFEINALVSDANFAERVETMLVQDFAASQAVTAARLESKPFYFKVLSMLVRLVSPLL